MAVLKRWVDQQCKKETAPCQKDDAAHPTTLAQHGAYIQENKKLFGRLVKVYERQNKITGYMDKAEQRRKQAEEKYVAKRKHPI